MLRLESERSAKTPEEKFAEMVNVTLREYELKTGIQVRYVTKKRSTGFSEATLLAPLSATEKEKVQKSAEETPEKPPVKKVTGEIIHKEKEGRTGEPEKLPRDWPDEGGWKEEAPEGTATERNGGSVAQEYSRPVVNRVPELLPTEEEIGQAEVVMRETGDGYIKVRKKARSFWGNLREDFNVGFDHGRGRRKDTLGKRVAVARESYEEARNRYVELKAQKFVAEQVAEHQITGDTAKKELLAGCAASLLWQEANGYIGEDKKKEDGFLQRELRFNEKSWKYKGWSRYYRFLPLARFGAGWGLNIAIGVSIASGMLPLTGALVAARIALGTVGTEGALDKLQTFTLGFKRRSLKKKASRLADAKVSTQEDSDKISEQVKNFAPEVVRNLAFWHEDKIVRAYDKEPELPLWQVYNQHLRERIKERLLESASLAEALKVDELNIAKDKALAENRRDRALRWLAALGLSSALILTPIGFIPFRLGMPFRIELPKIFPLPGFLRPVSEIHPSPTPLPGPTPGPEVPALPKFAPYEYRGNDAYYQKIFEQPSGGEISSVRGRVQYALGKFFYGVFGNENDIYNADKLRLFDQAYDKDLLGPVRIKAGIDFYHLNTPPNAFDVKVDDVVNNELLQHKDAFGNLIKYNEPLDWEKYFADVGKSPT